MSLKIQIDVQDLAKQCEAFKKECEQDIKKGVASLAAMTHAHVKEMAQKELHSSREKFLDSLSFEQIAPGVWAISVGEKGMFVEEGIQAGSDMATDKWLLKNAKTNAKGEKYKIVPFEWSKARGGMNDDTKAYVDTLKSDLKQQKIPFKKLERNANGSPRIGMLHELNLRGDRSGGVIPGKGNTPIFDRVRIYQNQTKNEKTGLMKTKRDIYTFRTVKAGEGKWKHGGLEKKQFLEEAEKWFWQEFENNILPEIFRKWK